MARTPHRASEEEERRCPVYLVPSLSCTIIVVESIQNDEMSEGCQKLSRLCDKESVIQENADENH